MLNIVQHRYTWNGGGDDGLEEPHAPEKEMAKVLPKTDVGAQFVDGAWFVDETFHSHAHYVGRNEHESGKSRPTSSMREQILLSRPS